MSNILHICRKNYVLYNYVLKPNYRVKHKKTNQIRKLIDKMMTNKKACASKNRSGQPDLNKWPIDLQSIALPTELCPGFTDWC